MDRHGESRLHRPDLGNTDRPERCHPSGRRPGASGAVVTNGRISCNEQSQLGAEIYCVYKITGRRVQQWLAGHRVEIRCVAAHPRLERFTTSGYTELISWDLAASRPLPIVMEPNPGAVTALAYSRDGTLMATASWPMGGSGPREVVIRDGHTGKARSRFSGPDIVYAMSFDPTGQRLACGDQAGTL